MDILNIVLKFLILNVLNVLYFLLLEFIVSIGEVFNIVVDVVYVDEISFIDRRDIVYINIVGEGVEVLRV